MTTTKEVRIDYYDIFSIAQRISSFEGREAFTAAGDSDYEKIHITTQDAPLIKDYIKEACSAVSADLGNFISDVAHEPDPSDEHTLLPLTMCVTIIYDSARTSLSNLENMLAETVATRAVLRWIDERKLTRREFFVSLYAEMVKSIRQNVGRKKKPSLTDYGD